MEDFLRVGVVTTTHGVRGEMKVYPTTDDPKRFLDLEKVFVDEPEGPKGTKEQPGKGPKAPVKTVRRERAVEGVKFFKNLVILKLAGIDDMDAAAKLRGAELYVSREDAVPLEEGEYYIADLLGMEVVSDEGVKLGFVKDVLETGANDVYIVQRPKGKPLLLPAIPECVLDIDVGQGMMRVHIMEGLLEL
ncbi:MAG: 16S rRNA processing protein RimM [Lachnospiraceae bacterium]|nr:16S rRNA processing protein RimM [Lachnospiraceae bacterium]